MKKALLIAEKPSVMNDIKNVYVKIKSSIPYDIDFGCCAGHLIGLYSPEEYTPNWGTPWKKDVLPILPDKWQTKVTNAKFYSELEKKWKSNNYDVIINAGDAGREGQLIQHLVYQSLGINIPILRYWADDTTEKTIEKALNNLTDDNNYIGLTESAFLRMYFDWLIGMNFSRAASLSLNRFTVIGRVMTPTLAMIVKREKEIINFIPVPYYELTALFTTPNGEPYSGTLVNAAESENNISKSAFISLDTLKAILRQITTSERGVASEVSKEEKSFLPPSFYNLADLQKDCSDYYNYSPSKTLSTAQSLYEKHYLSYPRTESKCITKEQVSDIPLLLNGLKTIPVFAEAVDKILSDKECIKKALLSKKYVDNKKVSDHPALTPTSEFPDFSSLSNEEKNVYTLVVCRFLAVFMKPNVISQTTILTSVFSKDEGTEHIFRSSGYTEIESGWKDILFLLPKNNGKKSSSAQAQKKKEELPAIKQGEYVAVSSLKIENKKTTPPKRYTYASLITAMETAGRQIDNKDLEKVLMECSGLGTPATRSDIIAKLFEHEYVSKKGKSIYPTEQGVEYINVLDNRNIISPELTAIWEKRLKEVELRTIECKSFYTAMVKYIKSETASLLTLPSVGAYKKNIGICPKCGRAFFELSKYYACEGYIDDKKCDFGLPKTFGGRPLTEADVKALISHSLTTPKEYKWSSGKTSITSLTLTDSYKIGFPTEEQSSLGKCPICSGYVLQGKSGFYCSNWKKKDKDGNPSCTFSVFGKIGERQVTGGMMSEILDKGETSKEIKVNFVSGKSFSGKIMIEKLPDEKYRFCIKPYEKKAIGKCPHCNTGVIYEDKFRYACNNTPSQGGSCIASVPKKINGHNISAKEALSLISGDKIEDVKFISKNNKKYQADLTAEIDSDKGMVLKINFKKNNK